MMFLLRLALVVAAASSLRCSLSTKQRARVWSVSSGGGAPEEGLSALQKEQTSVGQDAVGVGKKTAVQLVDDFFMRARSAGRGAQWSSAASSALSAANVQFINDIRSRGSDLLDALPPAVLPSGRQEAWKYTSMRTLFEPSNTFEMGQPQQLTAEMRQCISRYIDASCTESCLVFLDGIYSAEMSNTKAVPAGVAFTSLGHLDAVHFGTMLEQLGTDIVDSHELPRNSFASDTLSKLSLANTVDGACVRVEADTLVKVPMQVLFYSTPDSLARHTAAFPRLVVDMGPNSEARLKQTFVGGSGSSSSSSSGSSSGSGSGGSGSSSSSSSGSSSSTGGLVKGADEGNLVVGSTRISVARGARLKHTYEQDLPLSSRHLEVIAADIKGDSSYAVTVLQMGSRLGRVNAHVNITDPSANCTMHGVTLAFSKQSLDLHSSIQHNAEAQVSRQQQRNVVGEGGEAIFKGRIRIPKQAQQTDSDQLCRSLMLGERARVIAMPTLEITADDVTCSHGASVADLDENSMFYLAARGVDRKEARALLLRGFVLELVQDDIMDPVAESRIISKLESMNPSSGITRAGNGDVRQKLVSM